MSHAAQFAGVWSGAGGPAAGIFLLSIVSNLLLLTGPMFMLQVYDRVLASKSIPTLVALIGLVAMLYGFYAFLEMIRARMAVRFAELFSARHAAGLFAALMRSSTIPSATKAGDPVRDLDSVRQFLSGQGLLSLLDLPWVPLYLALVFTFHPMLGWLATAGAAVITVLMIVNELVSQKPAQRITAAMNQRQSALYDVKANAESIAAMGMSDAMIARWIRDAANLLTSQRQATDRAVLFSSLTKAFRLLLQSGVLALGAFFAVRGEIGAGLMIVASIVSARALAPIEQVIANWRGFVSARQATRRIRETLATGETRVPRTALPLPHKSLAVSDLVVAPSPKAPPILTGISFELEAGEALGVLGVSGCGKSSLVRTLVGVWPALSGTVRLDGSEHAHFDPQRLGAAIGYLPQMVELFEGTVAENISRFRPDATSEAVVEAARAAGIHDLVAALPDGYDTPVGQRGALLSAGQRQRLGLARALFGAPFLIVLDEPNSNLDADGDAALNAALLAAKQRGSIVIVVAHRPSAIQAVDKILFLREGKQAAFGPKDDILRAITPQPTPLEVVRKARAQ